MKLDDIDHRRLADIGEQLAKAVREAAAHTTSIRPATVRAGLNPETRLDRAVDVSLHASLVDILPVPVLSEERVPPESIEGLCWVVDPIDGTINAMVGSPNYAISVALVNRARETYAAAVYLPQTEVLFEARRGQGAYRNGVALDARKATRARMSPDIAAFGVSHHGGQVADRTLSALHYLLTKGWITRQTGAAAIDICFVADGQWSGFLEYRLQYWDFAAAVLIAEEANCVVRQVPVGPSTNGIPIEYDLIVARNNRLANVLENAMKAERRTPMPVSARQ